MCSIYSTVNYSLKKVKNMMVKKEETQRVGEHEPG